VGVGGERARSCAAPMDGNRSVCMSIGAPQPRGSGCSLRARKWKNALGKWVQHFSQPRPDPFPSDRSDAAWILVQSISAISIMRRSVLFLLRPIERSENKRVANEIFFGISVLRCSVVEIDLKREGVVQ